MALYVRALHNENENEAVRPSDRGPTSHRRMRQHIDTQPRAHLHLLTLTSCSPRVFVPSRVLPLGPDTREVRIDNAHRPGGVGAAVAGGSGGRRDARVGIAVYDPCRMKSRIRGHYCVSDRQLLELQLSSTHLSAALSANRFTLCPSFDITIAHRGFPPRVRR